MENLKLSFIYKYTETTEYRPFAEKTILPVREREIETIFSMGNGYIGTRNSLEESYPESDPGSFIAGMYVQGPEDDFNFLVRVPDWTSIKIYVGGELLELRESNVLKHIRYIDFENGTVVREWKHEDKEGRITSVKILKYISLAEKHELGKLLIVRPENYSENINVVSGIDCNTADFDYLLNLNSDIAEFASMHMKTRYSEKEFALIQKSDFSTYFRDEQRKPEYDYKIDNFYHGSFENFEWQAEIGYTYLVKSLCCVATSNDTPEPVQFALSNYEKYNNNNFEASLIKHISKWKERFEQSQVKISGNDFDRKLVDFALYHLITAGEFSGGRHSIPARTLSGESYKGHVFWDTEMYLLPFFLYTKPEIAKNLLMYRYNTLDGARQNAVNEGFKGACFAWESTDSGLEAAPEMVILPNGEVVMIFSGLYENHISSDIAYSVWKYWQATLDDEFMTDFGAEILFETARFCKSLLRKEEDGFYHIYAVIGPDEYHECVEDNAYTNYLVKHNLDFAVRIYDWMVSEHPGKLDELKQKINLEKHEIDDWKGFKDNIYHGYDEQSGIFEQFKGFHELEYIDLQEYEPRSVPMDVILGRKRTEQSQVIKQPDVLMFMMLFGEHFSQEQLVANYEFYEERCGHGSSLSPSIHSIMAARAGKTREAYDYFLKNAKIDIGDAFGNAAGGIHIAALGGVWMSLVFGFAGMHPVEKGLIFDPNLPDEWNKLEFSIKWQDQDINVVFNHNEINFSTTGEKTIYLSVGFDNWKEISPGAEYTAIKDEQKWEWKEIIYERESIAAS